MIININCIYSLSQMIIDVKITPSKDVVVETMTKQEKDIANNVVNKLQLILDKKRINILALSGLLKVDKQALYRLMRGEHIPSLVFLEKITDYLNCTFSELISEKLFLDINVYSNCDFINNVEHNNYRIYFQDKQFNHIVNNDFFGILDKTIIKVFYKADKILNDGYYLIHDKNSNVIKEIDIISVGRNLIIAIIDGEEVRLELEDIDIKAKLYKTLSIIQNKEYAIKY